MIKHFRFWGDIHANKISVALLVGLTIIYKHYNGHYVEYWLSVWLQERDADRLRIQELAEENARLEFEKKSSFNESANLEEELSKARLNASPGGCK